MMLLDSHVLVWWLSGASLLSRRARRVIETQSRQGVLHVSAISMLEIATAVRRGRLDLGTTMEQWLTEVGALPEVQIEPVSAQIAWLAGAYAAPMHGDPVDRILVATAASLGLKLITADSRLHKVGQIECIW